MLHPKKKLGPVFSAQGLVVATPLELNEIQRELKFLKIKGGEKEGGKGNF